MATSTPTKFTVVPKGLGDQHESYTVIAEQTNRPKMQGGAVIGEHLEWQFYCEELKLILVRQSSATFVSIDDPSQVFKATEHLEAKLK